MVCDDGVIYQTMAPSVRTILKCVASRTSSLTSVRSRREIEVMWLSSLIGSTNKATAPKRTPMALRKAEVEFR